MRAGGAREVLGAAGRRLAQARSRRSAGPAAAPLSAPTSCTCTCSRPSSWASRPPGWPGRRSWSRPSTRSWRTPSRAGPHTWWLRLLYRGLERLTTHTDRGLRGHRAAPAALGRAPRPDLGRRPRHRLRRASPSTPTSAPPCAPSWASTPTTSASSAPWAASSPVKRMDVVLRAVRAAAARGRRPRRRRRRSARRPSCRRWPPTSASPTRCAGSARARDAAPVLSAMDVLVSASADETFGMAVVEARRQRPARRLRRVPRRSRTLAEPLEQAVQRACDRGPRERRRRGSATRSPPRLATTGQRRWPLPAVAATRATAPRPPPTGSTTCTTGCWRDPVADLDGSRRTRCSGSSWRRSSRWSSGSASPWPAVRRRRGAADVRDPGRARSCRSTARRSASSASTSTTPPPPTSTRARRPTRLDDAALDEAMQTVRDAGGHRRAVLGLPDLHRGRHRLLRRRPGHRRGPRRTACG